MRRSPAAQTAANIITYTTHSSTQEEGAGGERRRRSRRKRAESCGSTTRARQNPPREAAHTRDGARGGPRPERPGEEKAPGALAFTTNPKPPTRRKSRRMRMHRRKTTRRWQERNATHDAGAYAPRTLQRPQAHGPVPLLAENRGRAQHNAPRRLRAALRYACCTRQKH